MNQINSINLQTVIARNPDIIHSVMDDEIVMMGVEQGSFFGIDRIGSHIWNLLETPMKVEDLLAKLVLEYEVEYDQCKEDTLLFLNEMLKNKVILL